jgi:hypothetical protein
VFEGRLYDVLNVVVLIGGGLLLVAGGLCLAWAVAHPVQAWRVMAAVLRHPGVPIRVKVGCVVCTLTAIVVTLLSLADVVRAATDGASVRVTWVGPMAIGLALLSLWLIPVLELSNPASGWRVRVRNRGGGRGRGRAPAESGLPVTLRGEHVVHSLRRLFGATREGR